LDKRKENFDVNGQVIISSENYNNWKVVGSDMFAQRIELQFDVRINCELQKK
jgi:hypothetical protein